MHIEEDQKMETTTTAIHKRYNHVIGSTGDLRVTKAYSKADSGGRCRKHPKHHQSPGVCSVCLREKLFELSPASGSRIRSATVNVASYSSSSSLSPLSSSEESSPIHRHQSHMRYFEKTGSVSFMQRRNGNRSKNVFTKSRSMVSSVVLDHGMVKKKEKRGFWSKLLIPAATKKKIDGNGGLGHSKAIKERAIHSSRVY